MSMFTLANWPLLFVCAAFHDLGLLKKFSSTADRFEDDSANAARQFLEHHGIPETRIQTAWDAISLHTTPGIGQYKQLEVELLFNGVGLDVLGIGYETFPEDLRKRVVARFPRVNFKEEIAKVSESAALLAANNSFGLVLPILNFGSEEQKRHYLGLAAKGRTLTAVAITEPSTGSDVSSMKSSRSSSTGMPCSATCGRPLARLPLSSATATEIRPLAAILSRFGVGITPPKVLETPNPVSSVIISRTFGASLGGATRAGQ